MTPEPPTDPCCVVVEKWRALTVRGLTDKVTSEGSWVFHIQALMKTGGDWGTICVFKVANVPMVVWPPLS